MFKPCLFAMQRQQEAQQLSAAPGPACNACRRSARSVPLQAMGFRYCAHKNMQQQYASVDTALPLPLFFSPQTLDQLLSETIACSPKPQNLTFQRSAQVWQHAGCNCVCPWEA